MQCKPMDGSLEDYLGVIGRFVWAVPSRLTLMSLRITLLRETSKVISSLKCVSMC